MIERNRAAEGPWREAVESNVQELAQNDTYNRLTVIQPPSHPTHPWPGMVFSVLSVSIWYNVLNQFMIQRVLGAKNAYHTRMGIVFAGFPKILLPMIVVVPGLIVFAKENHDSPPACYHLVPSSHRVRGGVDHVTRFQPDESPVSTGLGRHLTIRLAETDGPITPTQTGILK